MRLEEVFSLWETQNNSSKYFYMLLYIPTKHRIYFILTSTDRYKDCVSSMGFLLLTTIKTIITVQKEMLKSITSNLVN